MYEVRAWFFLSYNESINVHILSIARIALLLGQYRCPFPLNHATGKSWTLLAWSWVSAPPTYIVTALLAAASAAILLRYCIALLALTSSAMSDQPILRPRVFLPRSRISDILSPPTGRSYFRSLLVWLQVGVTQSRASCGSFRSESAFRYILQISTGDGPNSWISFTRSRVVHEQTVYKICRDLIFKEHALRREEKEGEAICTEK